VNRTLSSIFEMDSELEEATEDVLFNCCSRSLTRDFSSVNLFSKSSTCIKIKKKIKVAYDSKRQIFL